MNIKVCQKHGELSKDQYYTQKNGVGKNITRRCKLCIYENRLKKRFNCKTHGELKPEDIGSWGKCLKCRREQELGKRDYSQEYQAKKNKYGNLLSLHKVCVERGITIEQYQEMVAIQANKCAICLKAETRKKANSKEVLRLVIDHCHKTNKVRGLLCHKCNTSIGNFDDNVDHLMRAIDYINNEGYKCQHLIVNSSQ